MSNIAIEIGFVPLTDAAILIAACEMGFAAEEGLDLRLRKEVSWSNIRDKVSMDIYPMAHMLSPLALAMSLGLGPLPAKMMVPFVLNQNGNTLVAGAKIYSEITPNFDNPAAIGAALLAAQKGKPLRIGVPFPQSMHQELVQYWLESCGATPGLDFSFSVAPPSLLGQVLDVGEIDAFMVGEPWGSLAVENGGAEILMSSAAIWSAAPEKVLAVRSDWAEKHPDAMLKLVRAMYRASLWCGDRRNAASLAEILALPRYIGAPAEVIERALNGQLVLDGKGRMGENSDILRLSGPDVNFPWLSGAKWIADIVATRWGLSQTVVTKEAHAVFRPDIYISALKPTGVNLPKQNTRAEGGEKTNHMAKGMRAELNFGANCFFDNQKFY